MVNRCLIFIIFLAGAVGGVGGSFFNLAEGDPLPNWKRVVKHLIMGVIAAFMVPLFLNLISSNILDTILAGKEGAASSTFLLVGFCLVAAVSAKGFVEKLSGNVIGKLEKIESDVEALKDSKAAQEEKAEIQAMINPMVKPREVTPEAVRKIEINMSIPDQILTVFVSSPLEFMSLSKMAEAYHGRVMVTATEQLMIEKELDQMAEKKWVNIIRSDGLKYYSLSKDGADHFRKVLADQ